MDFPPATLFPVASHLAETNLYDVCEKYEIYEEEDSTHRFVKTEEASGSHATKNRLIVGRRRADILLEGD